MSAGLVIASRRSAGFGLVAGPRPSPEPHPSRVSGEPPGLGQRAAQQELDLGVSASQVVGGPPGQGIVDGWIQAEQ